MFVVNEENVEYIFPTSYRYRKDTLKQSLFKQLYFNKGKITTRVKNLLNKIIW